jgi:hypothetical protein
LQTLIPDFCRLWAKEGWQRPIIQAVTWLIEASKHQESLEGPVAYCQIPLEMLAWLLFVEDSAVVDQVDFKELGAANKIKLLLHHCGIFLEVPPQLQTLTKTAVNPQSKKVSPGPTVVVEIRNTIIHPHAANAKKFADWLNATDATDGQLLQETVSLFIWYLSLILLRFMDYHGEYLNHLRPQGPGIPQKLPWAP